MKLERVLTKKEILEKYLNVVQFGPDIFGVKKASHFYFNKMPAQLSVVESAFLAFLLPSPEKYSKSFFKKQLTPFARERLLQIVNRLYEYHRISSDEFKVARVQLAAFLGGVPLNAADLGDADSEGGLSEEDWMDVPPVTLVDETPLEIPQSEPTQQQQDEE